MFKKITNSIMAGAAVVMRGRSESPPPKVSMRTSLEDLLTCVRGLADLMNQFEDTWFDIAAEAHDLNQRAELLKTELVLRQLSPAACDRFQQSIEPRTECKAYLKAREQRDWLLKYSGCEKRVAYAIHEPAKSGIVEIRNALKLPDDSPAMQRALKAALTNFTKSHELARELGQYIVALADKQEAADQELAEMQSRLN